MYVHGRIRGGGWGGRERGERELFYKLMLRLLAYIHELGNICHYFNINE